MCVVESAKKLCIPFKFKNIWVKDPEFEELVREAQSLEVQGCHMFRLCKKLQSLKRKLKSLNLYKFSNLSSKVDKARAALTVAQTALKDDPLRSILREDEQLALELFRSLQSLLLAQQRQQAKALWVQ